MEHATREDIREVHGRISDLKDDVSDHEIGCEKWRGETNTRLTALEGAVGRHGKLLWTILGLVVVSLAKGYIEQVLGIQL